LSSIQTMAGTKTWLTRLGLKKINAPAELAGAFFRFI
jgi:hypothetical protein